ncbi:MAG TPA: hypothetical protein DCY27_13115 [Desulfobacterales bacterium]|nr:hypothetical protein [Desulfobacterales bacterium]
MKLRLVIWMPVLLCCLIWPAWAEEVEIFKDLAFEGGPWLLKADKLVYHTVDQTYEAVGRVTIRQGDRRITAEYIKVHGPTRIAELEGNVVIVLGQDILRGRTGRFNLVTRCGEISEARLFLQRNHFHVTSALIRKTGDDTFHAEKCVVTTCDADRPMWSFYSRELNVKLDGYAIGKATALRLGPIPVAFLPAAVLPVKTSRQSGFLMPIYSQHRAAGTVVEIPFYWAINNYMDATLYQMVVNKRGYLQGLEYRYAWDKDSGGAARFSYIRDGREEAPTPHRYWGVAMLNQNLPQGWSAKGTLDIPSDGQYLYDYNYGYLGLDRLSRSWAEDYGRNLEQFEVKTRVSGLVLTRNFSQGSVNFYGQYYRPLYSDISRPLDKAPSLNVGTLLLPLGSWPIHFHLNTAYTHYYHDYGLSGQRLDFHPRFSLNSRLFGTFDLEAVAGWRGTGYRVDSRDAGDDLNKYDGRSLYDVKTGLSTSLFKDWGRSSGSAGFVRHVFQPRVVYYNYQNFNVNRIPQFDPFDYGWQNQVTKNYPIFEGEEPIGGINATTYSLTNHFLRRSTSSTGLPHITDLFWSRLTQSIFFNSSNYGLDGQPQPHRRMSDIFLETMAFPIEQIGLGLDTGISPYHEGLSRMDVNLLLRDRADRNHLNISYIYLKNYANQINSSVFLDLFRSIKVGFSNQHTFVSGKKLENKYSLIFQRQCWGVSLNFADRSTDKYVSFSIIIPGLIEKSHAPSQGQQVL